MRRGIVPMRLLTSCAVGAILFGLTGCGIAARDSWDDPGSWRGTGVNDMNLQAMVANPNDLIAGRGERGASAVLATTAVNRYLTDKVKALPKAGGFGIGGGGGGEAGGGQTSGPQ